MNNFTQLQVQSNNGQKVLTLCIARETSKYYEESILKVKLNPFNSCKAIAKEIRVQ